jgi:hypothetical protein
MGSDCSDHCGNLGGASHCRVSFECCISSIIATKHYNHGYMCRTITVSWEYSSEDWSFALCCYMFEDIMDKHIGATA